MIQRLLPIFISIALGLSLSASAQGSKPAPIKKVKVHPQFAAGLHTEGSVIYTYVDEKHRRRLTLDLYRPEKRPELLPAIVMYFGGGWQNGRPGLFAAMAQQLAHRGYVCVVPEYRLSGEAPFPAAVHDAKAAIRWTRANAKRFGIDPNRIACLGGSAGGHLSGFMASTSGMERFEGQGDWQEASSTVQAAVVFAGPMNLLDSYVINRVENAGVNGDAILDFMGGVKPSANEAIYREASPLTHIGKHVPPMLFIDGERDRPRVRYTDLWKQMDKLEIAHEFVLMPEGPHPFWVYDEWFEPTVDAVDNFLKKHLPVPTKAIASEKEIIDRVSTLANRYFAEFRHPETGVLYGARLSDRKSWTSPADVLAEKPKPWGYGSRIADTGLHTGHILTALLDAYEARPAPFLKTEIRKCFDALKLIGSLPETHPKPNKPALEGLVPRGPHPDDLSAWFDDSSMDQHTTYIISLAVYANSSLATKDDKAWIKQSLEKVGRRLEKNNWSIKRADGITEAHVGFSWKGLNSSHASILLPAVLGLYHGTGDQYWLEQYEFFMKEAEGKRWAAVHPGPQIKINGHPIYANQNAFRVNAWYHFEKSPERKTVIGGLLKQSTEMQLARDFPGEMYRKFHPPEKWSRIQKDFNWADADIHGASSAWNKFRPKMLEGKDGGMAALAHVRFPLGGFHMVLQSEQPEIIREHLPAIWKMLNTVELENIDAGETHYLFTVVGLHLYALYFRHPELLD